MTSTSHPTSHAHPIARLVFPEIKKKAWEQELNRNCALLALTIANSISIDLLSKIQEPLNATFQRIPVELTYSLDVRTAEGVHQLQSWVVGADQIVPLREWLPLMTRWHQTPHKHPEDMDYFQQFIEKIGRATIPIIRKVLLVNPLLENLQPKVEWVSSSLQIAITERSPEPVKQYRHNLIIMKALQRDLDEHEPVGFFGWQ